MEAFVMAAQVILALGIFNVWLIRRDRPTPYRPAGASSLKEEFRRYGLPDWGRTAVGFAKVSLAVLLLVGVAYPMIATGAAALMAVFMAGAVGAHAVVRDPWRKAVPAFAMLVLSVFVVVGRGI